MNITCNQKQDKERTIGDDCRRLEGVWRWLKAIGVFRLHILLNRPVFVNGFFCFLIFYTSRMTGRPSWSKSPEIWTNSKSRYQDDLCIPTARLVDNSRLVERSKNHAKYNFNWKKLFLVLQLRFQHGNSHMKLTLDLGDYIIHTS